MKGTGRVMAAVFAAVLAVISMGFAGQTAYAKAMITYVQANCRLNGVIKNAADIPVLGDELLRPEMEITAGALGTSLRFAIDGGNGWWHKLREGGDESVTTDWKQVTSGEFSPGRWRFECQLRIDGDDAKNYEISPDVSIRVNGNEYWTVHGVPYSSDTFCYINIDSPAVTVETPTDFRFIDSSEFDIPMSVTGVPIEPFSVVSGVYNGAKPYEFYKGAGGPDWVKVSKDGTVSGTPTKAGSNGTMVIGVQSAMFLERREITIDVSVTREGVSNVTGTSDIKTVLDPGNEIHVPQIDLDPECVQMTGLRWKKRNKDGTWPSTYCTTGTIGKGEVYKLTGTLNIVAGSDYSSGMYYALKNPVKLTVDGNPWIVKTDSLFVEDYSVGASSVAFESPEITAGKYTTGSKTIYRLYNKKTKEHLWTSAKKEYDTLPSYGWTQEGVAWKAPSIGTGVYRLYNPKSKDHHYTSSQHEADVLTTSYGWVYDNNKNPVFYSGGSTPVYRLYNKSFKVGSHHFTKSKKEYDTLPSYGWKQEGTAFNCMN